MGRKRSVAIHEGESLTRAARALLVHAFPDAPEDAIAEGAQLVARNTARKLDQTLSAAERAVATAQTRQRLAQLGLSTPTAKEQSQRHRVK